MSDEAMTIACLKCGGGPKNHAIRATYESQWGNDDIQGGTVHSICECMGCNSVRFVARHWCSEAQDMETGECWTGMDVYPQTPQCRRAPIDTSDFPPKVATIYAETVTATNAGANTLAGGGLRAIVEGLCIDQGVSGGTLEKKIDDLVGRGLLAKPQAELLHEERYLGNAALHELERPSEQDLTDGLDIVESLLTSIYSLPKKARALKARRQGRSGNSPAPPPP